MRLEYSFRQLVRIAILSGINGQLAEDTSHLLDDRGTTILRSFHAQSNMPVLP
jgi:hypothetical protein